MNTTHDPDVIERIAEAMFVATYGASLSITYQRLHHDGAKAWWVYQRESWTWATNATSGEEAQVLIGVYVVADSRGRARASGACEMDCDFLDVGVRRAPEYDGMTADDIYRNHAWEWLV